MGATLWRFKSSLPHHWFSTCCGVFTMSEFEQFQALLEEQDIFYKIDSFRDGTQLFCIPQNLEAGGVVEVLVVFGDDYVKIVVLKIATINDPEKRFAVYDLFNDLNRAYKFFKFHIDSDGDVIFEGDLVTDLRDGEFHPDTLMAYIAAALTMVKTAYPKIMKIMWSD